MLFPFVGLIPQVQIIKNTFVDSTEDFTTESKQKKRGKKRERKTFDNMSCISGLFHHV